ncbi:MAG: fused MFS/spermidine synthase [Acidobacteria bacterium]|nr:fused MFS/spermidine synthase [Acidobacteriota bacterium]
MNQVNEFTIDSDKGSLKVENKKLMQFFVFSLFFFSGISGLIYQILWTRMLALIFGNTMLATSTVLTAYMAGLASGSFFAGKYIDKKPRRLVKLYAILEAGIGVFALIFPLLLKIFSPLYTHLYQGLEGNFMVLNLTRFLVCFILIFIPTFMMGATLPVLLKRFVKGTGSIGREMGILYGLNTAGAVAGSMACGFLLLKLFGMQGTTRIGVVINLAVAAAAWILSKKDEKTGVIDSEPAVNAAESSSPKREYGAAVTLMVMIGIGISGFCALSYELLWTRMLNLFFHNTVYSFTIILATFLTGIALGSFIYSKFFARFERKILLFVAVEIIIGVIAYVTPFIFISLYDVLLSKYSELFTVLKAMVVMIVPTILMGMALPLAVQICQQGPKREGDSVGTVYAVNTVGSILGSFAAGFILVPYLGIHKSVVVVAGLNILAGVLALFTLARSRMRLAYAVGFAAVIVVFFLGTSTPIFKNLYQENQPHAKILSYKEGKIANVVVYDFYKEGYKDLYLNGIEEASSRLWHVQLFKMLGILPPIIHPNPDDALMVAFGAGMSAGACAQQVKSFECAELNPNIHEVASIFSHENLDVINNPKFKLIVNDGRNQVFLSPKKYSLIISDATNPLTFDSWPLYTQEFYATCKEKLKPGGIFCQWVPIPLPNDAIKIILKTFKSVFPHTSFWVIYGSSQCLMLGTPERLNLDYKQLSQRLGAIFKTSGLAEYGIDTVEKFLTFFMIGEDKLDEMLAGFNKINTDDLPQAHFTSVTNEEGMQTCLDLLKYQESIYPYLSNMGDQAERVKKSLEDYLPVSGLLTRGFLFNSRMEYTKAMAAAEEKNFKDDKNIQCMFQFDPERKEYFLDRAKENPADPINHYNLGYIYFMEGNYEKAVDEFKNTIALKHDFAKAYFDLAHAFTKLGMYDEASDKLMELRDLNPAGDTLVSIEAQLNVIRTLRKLSYQPQDPELHFLLGQTYFVNGDFINAQKSLAKALELNSKDPKILELLGVVYDGLELPEKAVDVLEKLSAIVPEDPGIKQKLAQLKTTLTDPAAKAKWLEEKLKVPKENKDHPKKCEDAMNKWASYDFDGKISNENLRKAAAMFEEVIASNKEHMHAYSDAAAIYEALGDYKRAASLWEMGLKIAPNNEKAVININRLTMLDKFKTQNLPIAEQLETFNNIGFLFWGNKDFEIAEMYFKKLLDIDSQQPMVWANLGAAYNDSGKYKEAVQVMEKVLAMRPDFQYREQILSRLNVLRPLVNKTEKPAAITANASLK